MKNTKMIPQLSNKVKGLGAAKTIQNTGVPSRGFLFRFVRKMSGMPHSIDLWQNAVLCAVGSHRGRVPHRDRYGIFPGSYRRTTETRVPYRFVEAFLWDPCRDFPYAICPVHRSHTDIRSRPLPPRDLHGIVRPSRSIPVLFRQPIARNCQTAAHCDIVRAGNPRNSIGT